MKINGYVTDCFKSRYTTLGKPYFHVTQCFIGISLSFGNFLKFWNLLNIDWTNL